jgi:hypothetical protein
MRRRSRRSSTTTRRTRISRSNDVPAATKVSNNDDLYEVVRELAAAFERAGRNAIAKELRDALSISTVPGEVLGEIRNRLDDLRSAGVALTAVELARVDDALAYLTQVLQSR